ncbi:MAG: hypothetical protein QG585_431 [Patescibacteria group bacterium]|jgi:hypothetical protein|nr:hypothetical protein [Patescibacteria group bacterium]
MKYLKKISPHFLAFLVLSLVSSSFVLAQGNNNKIGNPLGGTNSLSALLGAVTNVLIQLGAIVAALAIMYGGFLYVTAQGNEEKLQKAQATVTWALVGTAVLLGSRVIYKVIDGTIREIS